MTWILITAVEIVAVILTNFAAFEKSNKGEN